MKINLDYFDGKPKMRIGELEGILLELSGRTTYIVSMNWMDDYLSTWWSFFIAHEKDKWKFDYRSNCQYSNEEGIAVMNNLLHLANHAISMEQSIDLSDAFEALDSYDPFSFRGLYSQMNERRGPIFTHRDPNNDLEEMRQILKNCMTAEEIEADKHLKHFVFKIPMEIIWVDDTVVKD